MTRSRRTQVCPPCPRRKPTACSNRPNRDARLAKKKSPGAGSARARTHLHRTHYRPRPNTTGQLQHALRLWQFFDGSLSISSIATSACGRAFTPRDASRTLCVDPQRVSHQRVPRRQGWTLCQRRGACTMLENRAVLNRDRGERAMRWRGERESENVEDRRDEGGGFPFPGGGVGFPSGGSGRGGGHRHSRHSHHSRPDVLLWRRPERDPARRTSERRQRSELPGYPSCRSRAPTPPIFRCPGRQGPQIQHPADLQRGRSQAIRVGGPRRDGRCLAGIFARYGERYSDPKLVLFTGGVRSACGYGAAQMGPFYCPNDEKVYIDLSFYQELKRPLQSARRFRPGLCHRA